LADAESLLAQALQGLRILVVEDNPINHLVLDSLLKLEGASPALANDDHEAIARLGAPGAPRYDAALLDVEMPGTDGYETAHLLHKIDPSLPLIGRTAHAMAEDLASCLEAGMLGRVVKPIERPSPNSGRGDAPPPARPNTPGKRVPSFHAGGSSAFRQALDGIKDALVPRGTSWATHQLPPTNPRGSMSIHRHPFARTSRALVAPLIVGCTLGLVACGGNDASPTVEQQLQALEQAGTLPKLDITDSVTGTDGNANGVRDDVDKIIAAQPDTQVQRAALTQLAQSIQASLAGSSSDSAAVAATSSKMNLAVACIFLRYADATQAAGQVRWLQEISVNTLPRLNAYEAFNHAMSGSVTHSATGAVCNV
jgi:CheY-like chemotaxis protein